MSVFCERIQFMMDVCSFVFVCLWHNSFLFVTVFGIVFVCFGEGVVTGCCYKSCASCYG